MAKSRDRDALNEEGRALVADSDIDQDSVTEQLADINSQWDTLVKGK